MGFLSGFLSDTNARIDSARTAERTRQDTLDANERATLSAVINSESAAPELRTRAISALAEMGAGGTRPKGGYLNRLISGGQASVHPAVQSMMDALHAPSSWDVEAGRAHPAGGGTAAAAPAGGTPGGTPSAAGGPAAAPPPAGPAGMPPPTVRPGSAAQPAKAATEPGGGPAAPVASFAPGGPPPAVGAPVGMAGVSFRSGVGAPPPGTPMPQGPAPVPGAGAGTGAGPAAGTPPPTVSPAAALPEQGVPQGKDFQAQVFRLPEAQRAATLKAEAGTIQPTLEAKVKASQSVWKALHPNASPEDEQQANDLIAYKELGTLPKFTRVAGDMTVEQAMQAYGDVGINPLDPNSPKLSTLPRGSFVAADRSPSGMMRFNPTTPNPQIVASNRAQTMTSLAAAQVGLVPGVTPTPELAAKALDVLTRRQQALQASGAKFSEAASLDKMRQEWKPITYLVRDADGTGHPVNGVINGVGEQAIAGPNGQPLKDSTGNLVEPPLESQPVPYGSTTALPNKISSGSMGQLVNMNTVGTIAAKLEKLLADSGLADSNNIITQTALNEIYSHGISTRDLSEYFDGMNQLAGYLEASGMRGLLPGGRTNIKLQDIISQHLPAPGMTWAAINERLKGLTDTIIPAARNAIIKTEATKLGPGGKGGAGGGAQPTPADLAEATRLNAAIQAEADPTKKAALVAQAKALMARFGGG